MIRKLIRGVITLLGTAAGYGVYLLLRYIGGQVDAIDLEKLTSLQLSLIAVALAIIFGFIFFLLTPAILRTSARAAKAIELELKHVSASDLLSGVAGFIIGLLIATLISLAFTGIPNSALRVALTFVVYIAFAWFGVAVGGRRWRDLVMSAITARRNALANPQNALPKGRGKHKDQAPKILDTSVIIDGRVSDIIRTGFLEGSIIIPEFVLVELRHIADSEDALKRNRGRRGLEILGKIQTDFGIEIFATDQEKALEDVKEVDVKLLKLAQIMGGKVVTNDYNLNKVAKIQGVEVLNINELANTLKSVVLPGEEMTLSLVKEGKEYGQALAYLDDGTMIVVEDGREYISKTIPVVVSSVLQTSAGKMIFARVKR